MPKDHPNLAILYGNMIVLYNQLNRSNESLDLQYKKPDIHFTNLQSDDPNIGIRYNIIVTALGRYE